MSSSTDNPLGTVGSFRRFPRSELNFESMQLEDDLAPSPVNSSNIWCKAWKFVWRVVAATLVLILLGYGLNQLANSGIVQSNASTTTIPPMPVWSAENSTIAPETSTSMLETAAILLESTTISMEATTSKTMESSTEFPSSMATVEPTTSKVIKLGSITPLYPLATDPFTTSSSTTVAPSTDKFDDRKRRPLDDGSCVQILGDQIYKEVKWLCFYCHRRGSVWNKTKWGFELESFESTCSSNCYDNKYRRACAKRAYEWNKKTGEFGSPFNCKHCYN